MTCNVKQAQIKASAHIRGETPGEKKAWNDGSHSRHACTQDVWWQTFPINCQDRWYSQSPKHLLAQQYICREGVCDRNILVTNTNARWPLFLCVMWHFGIPEASSWGVDFVFPFWWIRSSNRMWRSVTAVLQKVFLQLKRDIITANTTTLYHALLTSYVSAVTWCLLSASLLGNCKLSANKMRCCVV